MFLCIFTRFDGCKAVSSMQLAVSSWRLLGSASDNKRAAEVVSPYSCFQKRIFVGDDNPGVPK